MTSLEKTAKNILNKNIILIKKYGYTALIKKLFIAVIIAFTIVIAQIPHTTYANTLETNRASTLLYIEYGTNYTNEEISDLLLQSKVINWSEGQNLIQRGETFKILEPNTGTVINLKRTGGSNHMDVETLTKADTDKMKMLWGGFSWERKGFVLIKYSGESYIVSMHGMPHAGNDNVSGGKTVKFRSCGFGQGTNWDFVKDNGMDGHICIHFIGSRTHCSKKIDYKHQNEIHKIEQLKNKALNHLMQNF